MTLLVALFGIFIATLGVAGVVAPERLLALVTRTQAQLGIYFLAAFRLLMGGALVLAAPPSRAPLYLMVLGGLSLVSGALSPLFGTRGFERVLAWWRARPAWAVRAWSAFVCVFGLSLVWAVFPLVRDA
ncbi:MAG: hypothetical protein HKP30_02070 [Myxococcales bacterium]|nr:hypothetical protein [Myxococcales bacterium]